MEGSNEVERPAVAGSCAIALAESQERIADI
jgi:hypothetical protein